MKPLCHYVRALERRVRSRRDLFTAPVPELRTMSETVKGVLWAPEQFSTIGYLRMHERADWTGCPVPLREFTHAYFKAARKKGFPLYVHTCWRSPELQAKLQLEGHSTLRSGAHQRSCAVDVLHPEWHWELPRDAWLYLGALGREVARMQGIKVRWGGDFKSLWDPAHWELEDWRSYPIVSGHRAQLRKSPYGLLKYPWSAADAI